jgi:hypothetical protein
MRTGSVTGTHADNQHGVANEAGLAQFTLLARGPSEVATTMLTPSASVAASMLPPAVDRPSRSASTTGGKPLPRTRVTLGRPGACRRRPGPDVAGPGVLTLFCLGPLSGTIGRWIPA